MIWRAAENPSMIGMFKSIKMTLYLSFGQSLLLHSDWFSMFLNLNFSTASSPFLAVSGSNPNKSVTIIFIVSKLKTLSSTTRIGLRGHLQRAHARLVEIRGLISRVEILLLILCFSVILRLIGVSSSYTLSSSMGSTFSSLESLYYFLMCARILPASSSKSSWI